MKESEPWTTVRMGSAPKPPSMEKKTDPTSEQKSNSLDMAFRSEVVKFFLEQQKSPNEWIRSADSTIEKAGETDWKTIEDAEKDKADGERMLDRLHNYGKELTRLSSDAQLEAIRQNPQQAAGALAYLAGRIEELSFRVPELDENDSFAKEQNREQEVLQGKTKKVFTDSMARIFPGIKAPPAHDARRQLGEMETTLSSLQDPYLKGLEVALSYLKKAESDWYANPSELLQRLNSSVANFGRTMGHVAEIYGTEIPKETEVELAAAAKVLYRLQLMRDDVQKQMYGNAKTPKEMARVDEINEYLSGRNEKSQKPQQEGGSAKNQQPTEFPEKPKMTEKPLSLDEVNRRLYDKSITDIEGVRAVMTPEAKAAILAYALEAVDRKLEQAKRVGMRLEARNMGAVNGPGVETDRKYQFAASVVEGQIVNPKNIGIMRVDEYLEKYLGYDIRADQRRKKDLESYTNLLER